MIHVTKCGITYSSSTGELEFARLTFAQNHWVRLPKFFDPDFCEIVQKDLRACDFQQREKSFFAEAAPGNSAAPFAILMLLNNSALFKIIEEITGCARLGCFLGRIYRHLPGTSHHLDWHSDWNGRRQLALTVNLSDEPYEGGTLMLRERNTGKNLAELTNTGLGDAILFRIGKDLEHMVSDVSGATARTTLAGWFESGRDFRMLLAESISHSLKREH